MLTQSTTISSQINKLPPEDYELLRKKGIEHIQKLAGQVWTDYNVHDPGVTILELLCYALTDLAYRTNFNIPDLLTRQEEKGPARDNAFFTPAEILTTHSVTVLDYRKLLLDKIPGLRNVWFYTNDDRAYTPAIYYHAKKNLLTKTNVPDQTEALSLKGLYTIVFEMDDYNLIDKDFLQTLRIYRNKPSTKKNQRVGPDELEAVIKNLICTIMQQHRNLCEDVRDIKMLKEEKVAICAEIELVPAADAQEVWLEIYRQLYAYISPSIKFYSLEEMVAKNKRMEEIFQGSVAERGFVDYDELEKFNQLTTLYTSDIISIMMDIKGVQAIRNIHLSSYRKNTKGEWEIAANAEKYCLHLSNPLTHTFKLALDFNEEVKIKQFNHINFYKDYVNFSPKHNSNLKTNLVIAAAQVPQPFSNDIPLPTGNYRQISQYISIQNEFPNNYMLGQDAVPASVSATRQAQRLQLKGYLIFFEQLLANYLAQLTHIPQLLSWNVNSPNRHTYFYADLLQCKHPFTGKSEVSDLDKLLDDYGIGINSYQNLLEDENAYRQRKNRLLDHLLARFNEQFTDYSLFKFSQDSGTGFYNSYSDEEMMRGKSLFLKNYPQLSSKRSTAINYCQSISKAYNISGLELRMNFILGLNNTAFKKLVKVVESSPGVPQLNDDHKLQVCDNRQGKYTLVFGLHVLEHILLRPQAVYDDSVLLNLCKTGDINNLDECIQPDHYSLKITVVLPGWLAIAADMNWRSFIENRIRLEAPAHIGIKICWLNPAQMYRFEITYSNFMRSLAAIKNCSITTTKIQADQYLKDLKELVTVLSTLKNMYPPSALENCNDIAFDKKGVMTTRPVMLNRTALAAGNDAEYVFVKCKREQEPF